MTEISIVITTLPSDTSSGQNSVNQGNMIANILVEEKLVACVNVISNLNSIYSWEGKICNSGEQLLIMKTSNSKLNALEIRLKELHPYEVFEFAVIAVNYCNNPYLNWVLGACR